MATKSTVKSTSRQFIPSATAYCGSLGNELPPMQGDLQTLNTRLELMERPLRHFVDHSIAYRVACERAELVDDMVQGARIAIWRKWQQDPNVAYCTDGRLKSIGKWGAINEARRMRGSSTYQQGARGQQRTHIRREVVDSTGVDNDPDTSLLEHAERQQARRQGWQRPTEHEAVDRVFADWLVDYILQCAPTEHQRNNIRTLINRLKDGYTWLEAGRAEGWCSAKAQKIMAFIREKAENATGWPIERDKRGATGTINKAREALATKRAAAKQTSTYTSKRGGGAAPLAAAAYPA